MVLQEMEDSALTPQLANIPLGLMESHSTLLSPALARECG